LRYVECLWLSEEHVTVTELFLVCGVRLLCFYSLIFIVLFVLFVHCLFTCVFFYASGYHVFDKLELS